MLQSSPSSAYVDFAPFMPVTTGDTIKRHSLTTAELARIASYSTQQVRDLERLGVLPAAERGSNGYRRYQQQHIDALLAYRGLSAAAGPVRARTLMPAIVNAPPAEGAAAIDALHAEIARDREAALDARRDLALIQAGANDAFDDERDSMSIAELGRALGVPASTLRHWEAEGLVRPDRLPETQTRQYGRDAIDDARIVSILRAGGHGIPTIAHALNQMRTFTDPREALRLIDARLEALAHRSLALLRSARHLANLLDRGGDSPSGQASG